MNITELEQIFKNILLKNPIASTYLSVMQSVTGIELIRAVVTNSSENAAKILAQVLVALGAGAIGAYLIVLAILDPEPISKLGALIIGGTLLMSSGTLGMLAALGQKWELSLDTNTVCPANALC